MFIFLYFLRIYTYSAYTYIYIAYIVRNYTLFYPFHPFQNAKRLERVGGIRGTDWLFYPFQSVPHPFHFDQNGTSFSDACSTFT